MQEPEISDDDSMGLRMREKRNDQSSGTPPPSNPPPVPPSTACSKTRNFAVRYITILQWLPKYNKEDAVCDAIAGITLGLTMLPQSIAYALLAGLSPQYGLYSSFVGVFMYIFLGSVKEISIGLTALLALLTSDFAQELSVDFVMLLTFLSGWVELLFGILHLGVLVEFISKPVVSGFTTATAIIIAEAQMKGLLGIKYKATGFLDNTWKLISNIQQTKLPDAVLGCTSIVFLLALRSLKDIPIGTAKKAEDVGTEENCVGEEMGEEKVHEVDRKTERMKRIKKFLWYVSLSRNAIIVLIGAILAFVLEEKMQMSPFDLSGKINPGFPPLSPPPFSTIHGNVTYNFGEMVMEMKSGIAIISIVSVLSNVAIAKAYSTGGKVSANQEMVVLGLCNIAGAFVSSMPMCGGFTRSAVSSASGVRTPLAGLYTGTLILLALGFLTPYFYYIPRSTLSAVLISAIIFMADFEIFKTLWRNKKQDFFAALATFLLCLGFGIEIGLFLGVLINCSFLLYFWARPKIQTEHKKVPSGNEYVLVTPSAGLYFPSIDFIRDEIGKIGTNEADGALPIVLNCLHFNGLDYSAAKGVDQIIKDFKVRDQPIALLKLRKEDLNLLEGCQVANLKHCEREEEIGDLLFGDKNLDGEGNALLEVRTKAPEDEEETSIPLLERQIPSSKREEKY